MFVISKWKWMYKRIGAIWTFSGSLGAEMWRKAAVELSDALIYITKPLPIILITFTGDTHFLVFLFIGWILNAWRSQVGWCVVEKSFCRNIRDFDLHHKALADNIHVFYWRHMNFLVFLSGYWVLVDLRLVGALWKKASVEISETLIHITTPSFASDI